jgi:hypothetical protein
MLRFGIIAAFVLTLNVAPACAETVTVKYHAMMKRSFPIALIGMFLLAVPAYADLLLFGGKDHDVFLGCLDCNEFDSSSICNDFGKGNEFNKDGLFNEFSSFGNSFSSSSPWNEYSSSDSVPVLVDRQGKFYGYFTVNAFRTDAVGFANKLAEMYKLADGKLEVVRNLLCENR